MIQRLFGILAALFALLVFGPAVGAPYPQPVDTYMNDFAGLIEPDAAQALRGSLAALERETGIQMAVLTIRARSDYDPSTSIADFAQRVFNGWGIGDPQTNDGILLLVSSQDREIRIHLGAAYDQAYDVIAQDIVSNVIAPRFREEQFSEGIEDGIMQTIDRIALRLVSESPHDGTGGGFLDRIDHWIFGAIAGIVGYGLFGRKIRNAAARLRRCPGCGTRGLRRVTVRLPEGGRRLRTYCRNCDYRDDRMLREKRDEHVRHRRRTNSSGGFGGGRSSGGGASGKW
ncbi:uncharacterized protein LV82_00770 [Albidovulum inexpectatum]|uniref:TPM domain-containing protein n=1 Tax=Albidovulum inexpectatum TaxID=196587 RepID=A0A2S5JJJ0_9RHOB|nr:TPM domain-containing protein [Albidovulum inexpectatum]PPB81561.1 uncharacterized protein LV82_00770 [Albidovulum inexpectatum]